MVDGPRCRPLYFTGLIGTEKFFRRERMSEGLCLFARPRAMNNSLIITASKDPVGAEATIYSWRRVSGESVVLTIAETVIEQLNCLYLRSQLLKCVNSQITDKL